MPVFIPIALAVISAISAFSSSRSQRRAARAQRAAAEEQRRIAELNAVRVEQETEEKIRRLGGQFGQEEALARARAAASGFKIGQESTGDSIALSLAAQQRENARQLGWESSAGASRASIIRRGGDVEQMVGLERARQMRQESTVSLIKAGTSAARIGQSFYNWSSAGDVDT